MSEISVLFVPVGFRPYRVTLDTSDLQAALADRLGGPVERLWPCCEPNVFLACRKSMELDLSLARNRCVTCGHGEVLANIFGDFCVVMTTPDGTPADMDADQISRFARKFDKEANNCGYQDDCPSMRDLTEDFVVENDYLTIGAGIGAEYHADSKSFVLYALNEAEFRATRDERERRQILWQCAKYVWEITNKDRFPYGQTVGKIEYTDDTMKCVVYGDSIRNRLNGCWALHKSLMHLRHPEKRSRLSRDPA